MFCRPMKLKLIAWKSIKIIQNCINKLVQIGLNPSSMTEKKNQTPFSESGKNKTFYSMCKIEIGIA